MRFFKLTEIPGGGYVTAAISLALAEWLIRTRHFFGTGIESALWLGGLFAFIFGLPGEGSTEVILLFAAASAFAELESGGLRPSLLALRDQEAALKPGGA